ncbi:hypothetical protein DFJ74DRAFT_688546 [Hyaloraphidium curvatum]|nr:hypothetical protein DFJ74DRAFT_688546 [Hyaloraphidium curvatum]
MSPRRARPAIRAQRSQRSFLLIVLGLGVIAICLLDAIPGCLGVPVAGKDPAGLVTIHQPLDPSGNPAGIGERASEPVEGIDGIGKQKPVSPGLHVPELTVNSRYHCPQFDQYLCDYPRCVFLCNDPKYSCTVQDCHDDCARYFDRYCGD